MRARLTAVAALVDLASAPDYRDRADAGRALASFAADPGARATLTDLVLDAGDTFVTRETAEALLRRHDAAGLSVVAGALASAEPDHADWIHSAVVDVFTVWGRERDDAVGVCEGLVRDPDDRVRAGAALLIEMLAEIDPLLIPAPDLPADTSPPATR